MYQLEESFRKEKLLSKESWNIIEEKIYSHKYSDSIHLIRLPLIFWTLYSSKKNMKIEDVIKNIELSTQTRIQLGTFILNTVKEIYPYYKPIKNNVPGCDFSAINYHPQLLPIITSASHEFGKLYGYW
jgi:hypothetical protein